MREPIVVALDCKTFADVTECFVQAEMYGPSPKSVAMTTALFCTIRKELGAVVRMPDAVEIDAEGVTNIVLWDAEIVFPRKTLFIWDGRVESR